MTDLEMTKLCAEAMGYEIADDFADVTPPMRGVDVVARFAARYRFRYEPIHDDAQAMALVHWLSERGHLSFYSKTYIEFRPFYPGEWDMESTERFLHDGTDDGRRHAVVECVAKMQAKR